MRRMRINPAASKTVDLRSDTLTRPTRAMLLAMAESEVGDDCFGEDPTVQALEARCANLFGHEAALLLPSGTMSNQLALRCLTNPGDEVICDSSYHVNFFEASPTCDLAKVSVNPVTVADGILSPVNVDEAISRRARWSNAYAKPTLIWIENTINGHGGRIYPLDKLRDLSEYAQNSKLNIFMDGARLFNAIVATGIDPKVYGGMVTALTVCFSKGMGAPIGSVLIGSKDFVRRARVIRKWYGGAMHQSGFIAAAALFALDNNLVNLKTDHQNARSFYRKVSGKKNNSYLSRNKHCFD